MRRALGRRQLLLLAAALASFLLAGLLGAVAVDVSRWRQELAAGDVRYRVFPADAGWRARTLVPGGAGAKLLGVTDDVAFRVALTAFRRSELDDATVSDPALAVRRAEATHRFESIVAYDRDPARRSRAANFLGVLGIAAFNTSPSGGAFQDRSELLLDAIASFRQAIALDPANSEAKYNLQLILGRRQGLLPTEASGGRNPAPGGRGARGAGAGQPGSGY